MVRSFFRWGLGGVVVAAPLVLIAAYLTHMYPDRNSKSRHVVLVGASIGQSWNLSEWSTRTRNPTFTAEAVAAWQFDKADVLQEVLRRPAAKFRLSRTYVKSLLFPPRRPAIVILKECSSYFPGDLDAYQRSFRQWIRQLRDRNLQVIVATVVPVTQARSEREPGKQASLLEFNRWLRSFAAAERMTILDLETALRSPADGSYLREEFAAPDGSHLNPHAYAALDQVLTDTLGAVATSGL